MLFFHPGALYRFEIPDAWLQAAGAHAFVPRQTSYLARSDSLWLVTRIATLRIRLAPDVVPQFDARRMVEVLRAMVLETPLPALWCAATEDPGLLLLRDGLHRYHAALALRFKQVPVACPPDFAL